MEGTRSLLVKKSDLEIRSSRRVGGRGQSLLVGEAAGLQDFFAGFGIKYAIGLGMGQSELPPDFLF
ncbi:MAG: hypothetical protein JW991_03140 [Candidatus Pacebacteria bacterium]|nr:hypothetical protein [Candidatus Paceibacterota bacterium]